ncbi:MAG: tRNA (adenosine(37)-N6)-threonylcarbamoyltransferase complex transferase subunit TsaD [Planctomycetota bacterium]
MSAGVWVTGTRLILGIETSCDETAAAVVDSTQQIRSSVVRTQVKEHAPYGGIVPELAARAHDRNLQPVIRQALDEAGISDPAAQLDAVAVTNRPGLIGALLVGVSAAKTLAWLWGKPLIGVHHLQGHIHSARMAARIADEPPLPDQFVAMVVSGGHTAIYDVRAPLAVSRIGTTRDDAAGEAFDKVAALLGLDYPGGPSVQRAAAGGNPKAVRFPRSLKGDGSLDFSFSGIKTAVLYHVRGQDGVGGSRTREVAALPDICASFEEAVADVLTSKALDACERTGATCLAVVGGVAANARLRAVMAERTAARGVRLVVPPLRLCTDNAAMIAGMAFNQLVADDVADLSLDAIARAPI